MAHRSDAACKRFSSAPPVLCRMEYNLTMEIRKKDEETVLQNTTSENRNARICSDPSSYSLSATQSNGLSEHSHANEELQKGDSDSANEFYFESDHVCLKTNRDYRRLLKHLFIVETIRGRAIRNREKLVEQMNIALADPVRFVERLQNGEDMGFPKLQRVPPMPVIDWGKYDISENTASLAKSQHTRLSASVNVDVSKEKLTNEGEESKPSKLSQPWTEEEQKKLEDLLIQFPHEKTEARRWEKIAKVLGNRTAIQVASRVQKYFIKLMKAGIPVPGRMPSVSYLRKPKRKVIRQQPSTFLVSHTPQVYMLDSDEDIGSNYGISLSGSNDNSSDMKMDISDEENISPELRDTAEYKELILLKKSLKEKLNAPGSPTLQHSSNKCNNRCECDPIVGMQ